MRIAPVLSVLLLAVLGCSTTFKQEYREFHLSQRLIDLRAGERRQVQQTSGVTDIQGFRIVVPEGVQTMYVQVIGANTDIDLVLCDEEIGRFHEINRHFLVEAQSGRFDEALTWTREDGLGAGSYVLYAAALAEYEDQEISYDVLLSFDNPPEIKAPHVQFAAIEALTPLERAIAATVMLNTDTARRASGTVVTPSGMILTNYHVVTDTDGTRLDKIWVSLVPDARTLPAQVYIADVILRDSTLDLALLQVVAYANGTAVKPENLIWLPLTTEECKLGDDIRCLGYPAFGGGASLNTITFTQGRISGFEVKEENLRWYKSDCLLSNGNSGGPAINNAHELAGIATSIRQNPDSTQTLSYIRPVQALPKAWIERISKELK